MPAPRDLPRAVPRRRWPLPVTLVTGFLGSGKTTLINHILSNRQGVRAAVLVNEFGDIGIDNDLIIASADDMIELNNGCICCSTNNDLVDSIVRVLARADQLDHIIVETTGVATHCRSPYLPPPEFRDSAPPRRHRHGGRRRAVQPRRFDSVAARNQLRYADAILLNKCDSATARGSPHRGQASAPMNPDARIHRTTQPPSRCP